MSLDRIGPYVIVDALGQGGMGRVYLARDPRLDRLVAIKFLQGEAATNPGRRARFLREARAAAALHHPNVATVLDVGEADVDLPDLMPQGTAGGTLRVPYLVLEYVQGDDLRSRLLEGPMPFGSALRLARQVVEGLRAAHGAGIVHRDLKPGNIRITADGRAKILDFGLARFAGSEAPTREISAESLTMEGVALGTPPYMAPEQGMGESVDARADLFALGVILFEMIGGCLPFEGEHSTQLLRSVLRDEPIPLAQIAPWTPPRLVELVHRLLEKDPKDRPATAQEVGEELDSISRQLTDTPTVIDAVPAVDAARALRAGLTASRAAGASRAFPGGPARATATSGAGAGRWRGARARAAALAALVLVAGAFALQRFVEQRRTRASALEQFDRAERAMALDDHQAPRIAAELFERSAQIDPGFALAWARASQAWADAFEREQVPVLLAQAGAAADRAASLAPSLEETLVARARLLRLQGRAAQAVELLEPLAVTSRGGWKAHRELALAYERVGDLARAEERLLAAIGAREDYWSSWNDLGAFRIRTGDYAGARAALERAGELAPATEQEPEENLASLLFLEGEYGAALAAYEKIPLSGASPATASNLGTLYYFNGRMQEAEAAFRRATRMAPREALYRRNLADTLLRLEREAEAREEYAQALALVEEQLRSTPGDENLSLQRALYLARSGDCAEATRFASQLEASIADSAQARRALARPYALCGARLQALAHLRRAVALGFARQLLGDEDEFRSLRGDPEFDRLVGRPGAASGGGGA